MFPAMVVCGQWPNRSHKFSLPVFLAIEERQLPGPLLDYAQFCYFSQFHIFTLLKFLSLSQFFIRLQPPISRCVPGFIPFSMFSVPFRPFRMFLNCVIFPAHSCEVVEVILVTRVTFAWCVSWLWFCLSLKHVPLTFHFFPPLRHHCSHTPRSIAGCLYSHFHGFNLFAFLCSPDRARSLRVKFCLHDSWAFHKNLSICDQDFRFLKSSAVKTSWILFHNFSMQEGDGAWHGCWDY